MLRQGAAGGFKVECLSCVSRTRCAVAQCTRLYCNVLPPRPLHPVLSRFKCGCVGPYVLFRVPSPCGSVVVFFRSVWSEKEAWPV